MKQSKRIYMQHLADFETAKDLKERGFEQPEFKAGQFWYDFGGSLDVIISVDNDNGDVLSATLSDTDPDVGGRPFDYFKSHIFAPTAHDILAQIFLVGTSLHFDAADIVKMALNPNLAASVWVQRQKVKLPKGVIKNQEPTFKTGQEYWLKNVGDESALIGKDKGTAFKFNVGDTALTEYDLPAEDYVKRNIG